MQSVVPPEADITDLTEFWSTQQRNNPGALLNKKLRVVYHLDSSKKPSIQLEPSAVNPSGAAASVPAAVLNESHDLPRATEPLPKSSPPSYNSVENPHLPDQSLQSGPAAISNPVAAPSSFDNHPVCETVTNAGSDFGSDFGSVPNETHNDRAADSFVAPSNNDISNLSADSTTSSSDPLLSSSLPTDNTAGVVKSPALKKKTIDAMEISLNQALILALVTFLIGWYLF